MNQPLDALWAKIRRSDPKDTTSGIVAWLPLADHSADVAAVFETLLRLRGYRRRAGRLLSRNLTERDIARLAVFAYLHDIGKGNSGFQSKVLERGRWHSSARRGHVDEAVSLIRVPALLQLCMDNLRFQDMEVWFEDPFDFQAMLIAAWSHHGTPLRFCLHALSSAPDQAWQSWEWASPGATTSLIGREIRKHYQEAFAPGDTFPHAASSRFQAFFAGLLSLADWIGSNESWFGFNANSDKDRMTWARTRSASLLALMGMDPTVAAQAIARRPDDFGTVFGIASPNAVQAAVLHLQPRSDGRGSVMLIEAETGSGKTEAALAYAFALYRAGEIDGAYFALPTRTSGVQIHGRMQRAVLAAFGAEQAPPVVLAVPGYQRPDDSTAALLCDPSVRWDEGMAGAGAQARGWFSEHSKRYLASAFAAGTVDQLLLSALRNKHAHLRAASMARSLLVIDEVHASDAYMTKVAAEVVRRHVAAGGHVLLMSATLGAEAACLYLGGPAPTLRAASDLCYPLIRRHEEGAPRPALMPIPVNDHPAARTKTVRVVPLDLAGNDCGIAALAAGHAMKGARVLLIRNTVAACIGTRRAVAALLPPECGFSAGPDRIGAPHHGRFAARDRILLDEAVEREFGKDRPPGGLVLVATQTVEQSLDIDADVLITDLCPMDVLLQRIGRLHRHVRDGSADGHPARPDGYAEAVCFVICPPALLPLVERPAHGIGENRAYQDVRVVELTVRQIRACSIFNIPAMNRALVEATVHSEAKAALDAEDPAWATHGCKVEGSTLADKWTAQESLLAIDSPFGSRAQFGGWDGAKATTRLGQPPISAIFPEGGQPISPFGPYRLPIVPVPHWMAPDALRSVPEDGAHNGRMLNAAPDPVPMVTLQREDGFEFEFAGQAYTYDADGLHKREEP